MKVRFILGLILLSAMAVAQSQHGVDLTWTASTDAAANPTLTYNAYRLNAACPASTGSAGTGGFTKVNASAISTLEYFDALPAPQGTTLCYYLTAQLNGLESVPSTTVQAVFLPPPFPAVSPQAKVK